MVPASPDFLKQCREWGPDHEDPREVESLNGDEFLGWGDALVLLERSPTRGAVVSRSAVCLARVSVRAGCFT